MASDTLPLSREDFLWLLGSLCNIHRLPFDAKLTLNQFPPPYGRTALIEAAGRLGFDVSDARAGPELAKLPAPFVAFESQPSEDAAVAESGEPRNRRSALVVKADAEKVLYFSAGTQTPQTVPIGEFLSAHGGACLLFFPKVKPAKDEDVQVRAQPFGFRWFVPELLKHRRVWRDVLLASFVIQLIALATPLCTQAIIDKDIGLGSIGLGNIGLDK